MGHRHKLVGGAAPSLADDATIFAPGPYIVTISCIDVANSLTFDASQAALLQTAVELIMVGALMVDSGFVSLSTTNIMSGVAVSGGVLAFGADGALGTGAISMTGGELLAAMAIPTSCGGTPTVRPRSGK